jgi:hypothetical protein
VLNPFFKNHGPFSIIKLGSLLDINVKNFFETDVVNDVKDLASARKW